MKIFIYSIICFNLYQFFKNDNVFLFAIIKCTAFVVYNMTKALLVVINFNILSKLINVLSLTSLLEFPTRSAFLIICSKHAFHWTYMRNTNRMTDFDEDTNCGGNRHNISNGADLSVIFENIPAFLVVLLRCFEEDLFLNLRSFSTTCFCYLCPMNTILN